MALDFIGSLRLPRWAWLPQLSRTRPAMARDAGIKVGAYDLSYCNPKESFRCEEKSCLYTSGYGDRVEMRQGESQQRIYYRIENFHQVDDPRRSRAMEAEKKRVQESGPRFTYAEDWYDKVEPGEKVYVLYRCFSDGQIQVWRVDIKQ
jgi:hypothetical protein